MNICPICNKSATYIYCSLSCSNRGRAKKVNKRKQNETKYYLMPNQCKQCSTIISYDKRTNIFCSQTCGAIFNNSRFPKRIKKYQEPHPTQQEKTMTKFVSGLITNRPTLRRILLRIRGKLCEICQAPNIWQNKPLTLIVDHVDGNAGNNFPSNVRLICPNCNSQTDTFSGRNKGNGRQSRGLSRDY